VGATSDVGLERGSGARRARVKRPLSCTLSLGFSRARLQLCAPMNRFGPAFHLRHSDFWTNPRQVSGASLPEYLASWLFTLLDQRRSRRTELAFNDLELDRVGPSPVGHGMRRKTSKDAFDWGIMIVEKGAVGHINKRRTSSNTPSLRLFSAYPQDQLHIVQSMRGVNLHHDEPYHSVFWP
jgi:hypothetical protein